MNICLVFSAFVYRLFSVLSVLTPIPGIKHIIKKSIIPDD